MYLFFELVEQPPVQDSSVLFFGCDNDGVCLLDGREIDAVGGDDIVAYPSLEYFLKLFTLLGIRPQYEYRVRHSLLPSLKTHDANYKVYACPYKTKKKKTLRYGPRLKLRLIPLDFALDPRCPKQPFLRSS